MREPSLAHSITQMRCGASARAEQSPAVRKEGRNAHWTCARVSVRQRDCRTGACLNDTSIHSHGIGPRADAHSLCEKSPSGGRCPYGVHPGWQSADERTIVGAFDHRDAMRCECPCSTSPAVRKEGRNAHCTCVRVSVRPRGRLSVRPRLSSHMGYTTFACNLSKYNGRSVTAVA